MIWSSLNFLAEFLPTEILKFNEKNYLLIRWKLRLKIAKNAKNVSQQNFAFFKLNFSITSHGNLFIKPYNFLVALNVGYHLSGTISVLTLLKKCWRQQKIAIFRHLRARISTSRDSNFKSDPIFHDCSSRGIVWYQKFWNLNTF